MSACSDSCSSRRFLSCSSFRSCSTDRRATLCAEPVLLGQREVPLPSAFLALREPAKSACCGCCCAPGDVNRAHPRLNLEQSVAVENLQQKHSEANSACDGGKGREKHTGRTTLRRRFGTTSFLVSACGGKSCVSVSESAESRVRTSSCAGAVQMDARGSLASPQRGQLVDGASRNWDAMQSWQNE